MENEKGKAQKTDQGNLNEDQKREKPGTENKKKHSGGREQERGQQGGEQGAMDKKVTDRENKK